jgi:hypothetical protein
VYYKITFNEEGLKAHPFVTSLQQACKEEVAKNNKDPLRDFNRPNITFSDLKLVGKPCREVDERLKQYFGEDKDSYDFVVNCGGQLIPIAIFSFVGCNLRINTDPKRIELDSSALFCIAPDNFGRWFKEKEGSPHFVIRQAAAVATRLPTLHSSSAAHLAHKHTPTIQAMQLISEEEASQKFILKDRYVEKDSLGKGAFALLSEYQPAVVVHADMQVKRVMVDDKVCIRPEFSEFTIYVKASEDMICSSDFQNLAFDIETPIRLRDMISGRFASEYAKTTIVTDHDFREAEIRWHLKLHHIKISKPQESPGYLSRPYNALMSYWWPQEAQEPAQEVKKNPPLTQAFDAMTLNTTERAVRQEHASNEKKAQSLRKMPTLHQQGGLE